MAPCAVTVVVVCVVVVSVVVAVDMCSSSVTGFCRDAVYSLTTDYNNGALRCDCSPDGSVSFNCEEFGGQCRCRRNVIGRTCSHCRTGYYGFPDCRRTTTACFIVLVARAGVRHVRGVRPNSAAEFRGAILDPKNSV